HSGFIAAWSDPRAGTPQVYCQRVDSTGTALWAANGVPASGPMPNLDGLVATSDELGGILVAWVADRDPGERYAFAQRVDGTGAVRWLAAGTLVDTTTGLTEQTPDIAADGTGGGFIVWTDGRNAHDDIFAQHVVSPGSRAWNQGGEPLVPTLD